MMTGKEPSWLMCAFYWAVGVLGSCFVYSIFLLIGALKCM